MLINIIIIAILLWAIYRGLKRGLIAELLYTIGYVAVFIFARLVAPEVSAWLAGWSSSAATSLGVTYTIAFLLLLMVGWLVIRLLVRWSRLITWLPVIKQANGLAGAVVAFVINYFGVFIVLSVLNFIPNVTLQSQLQQSSVAQSVVTKTPELTSQLLQKYLFDGHGDTETTDSNADSTSDAELDATQTNENAI
uniref:Colicin V production protein n=1 Tax=Loigolactobacillus rennini TaxID=238013 RepID=A0A1K2I8H9_9LACO|nr:Colicin V production protein [Loigolactobacillus rennini]